jgi:hypothetical protein
MQTNSISLTTSMRLIEIYLLLDLKSRLKKKLTSRTSLLNKAQITSMDPTTTQPSLLDHTLERLVLIRTTLVSKKHSVWLNDKLCLVIKDCNVAIKANSDISLDVFETDLLGGVDATPTHYVFDGDVAASGFSPQNTDA